ncbi:MAG: hypothetical protein ACLR76_10995 [Alistipes sp.]
MHYHTIVDSTQTILLGIHDIVVTRSGCCWSSWSSTCSCRTFRPRSCRSSRFRSVVRAFMVFPLFGFSINVFSLLGLVLHRRGRRRRDRRRGSRAGQH